MAGIELRQLRDLALSYPEVSERKSNCAPCFFIRKRLPFIRFHNHHRGDDHCSIWCPVGQNFQEVLVFTQPKTCFKPTTSKSGHFRNWVGVLLDTDPTIEWSLVTHIIERAYRFAAPKSLIGKLDKFRD